MLHFPFIISLHITDKNIIMKDKGRMGLLNHIYFILLAVLGCLEVHSNQQIPKKKVKVNSKQSSNILFNNTGNK